MRACLLLHLRISLFLIGIHVQPYGWYMACWLGYRVSRSLIPGNFTIDGNFFKFPFLKLFSIFSIFQFWFKIFESNFFQNSWLLKISGWKFQNTDDDLGWPLWCNSLLYWIPIPKDHYPHGKQSLRDRPGNIGQATETLKLTNRYVDGKRTILERVSRIWFM